MATARSNRSQPHSPSSDDFIDIIDGVLVEKVAFENIPEQFTKKENITVFFTVLDDTQLNSERDKIGLKQVGLTKARDCLAFAPVEFVSGNSLGPSRNGTATFVASILPSEDDEFYQFCYVLENEKILASSIPFQMNFSSGAEISLSDQSDQDKSSLAFKDALDERSGIVHVDNKYTLIISKLRQENEELLALKNQLEDKNQEYKNRISSERVGNDEQLVQLKDEIQALILEKTNRLSEIDNLQKAEIRLTEQYELCQRQCEDYQAEKIKDAENYAALEKTRDELNRELDQVRSQLTHISAWTQEQATQIIELRDSITKAENEKIKSLERQTFLENQMRDFQLTIEKNKLSIEGKLDSQSREMAETKDLLDQLQQANQFLLEENEQLKMKNGENEELLQREKLISEDFKHQIVTLQETFREKEESLNAKIMEMESKSRDEINRSRLQVTDERESVQSLKISLNQIKDRCLKHQKNEMELRKQLQGCQNLIESQKREIVDLTERIQDGAEKYKDLQQKLNDNQQMKRPQFPTRPEKAPEQAAANDGAAAKPAKRPTPSASAAPKVEDPQERLLMGGHKDDDETKALQSEGPVNKCPVCDKQFPGNASTEDKTAHIETHFTQ